MSDDFHQVWHDLFVGNNDKAKRDEWLAEIDAKMAQRGLAYQRERGRQQVFMSQNRPNVGDEQVIEGLRWRVIEVHERVRFDDEDVIAPPWESGYPITVECVEVDLTDLVEERARVIASYEAADEYEQWQAENLANMVEVKPVRLPDDQWVRRDGMVQWSDFPVHPADMRRNRIKRVDGAVPGVWHDGETWYEGLADGVRYLYLSYGNASKYYAAADSEYAQTHARTEQDV
jgi:hypothetical protein